MRKFEPPRIIKCKDCIWHKQCGNSSISKCSDFSSINDMSDIYVDEIIENKRIEYKKEWFKYIEECGDGIIYE